MPLSRVRVAAGACRSCAFRPSRMLAAAQGSRGQRRVRVGILRARRIAVNTPPSPCLRFRVRVAGRKAWLFRAICCVRGQKGERCAIAGRFDWASEQSWAANAGFELGFAASDAGSCPDSCLISATLGFLSILRHFAKRNALEKQHPSSLWPVVLRSRPRPGRSVPQGHGMSSPTPAPSRGAGTEPMLGARPGRLR